MFVIHAYVSALDELETKRGFPAPFTVTLLNVGDDVVNTAWSKYVPNPVVDAIDIWLDPDTNPEGTPVILPKDTCADPDKTPSAFNLVLIPLE